MGNIYRIDVSLAIYSPNVIIATMGFKTKHQGRPISDG